LGTTTSTATTTVTLPNAVGLSIGAICSGGAATTTLYVSGCVLNLTNGATGTAIAAYTNITGTPLTVARTTVLRAFDQLPYWSREAMDDILKQFSEEVATKLKAKIESPEFASCIEKTKTAGDDRTFEGSPSSHPIRLA
jgi:hypothetical protein